MRKPGVAIEAKDIIIVALMAASMVCLKVLCSDWSLERL